MAIIHAIPCGHTNQAGGKDQFSSVDLPMPRIPLPGERQSLRDHQDWISKLMDKVVLSSSVGVSPKDSLTTIQAQPQRQPRPSRTKKTPKSQVLYRQYFSLQYNWVKYYAWAYESFLFSDSCSSCGDARVYEWQSWCTSECLKMHIWEKQPQSIPSKC